MYPMLKIGLPKPDFYFYETIRFPFSNYRFSKNAY